MADREVLVTNDYTDLHRRLADDQSDTTSRNRPIEVANEPTNVYRDVTFLPADQSDPFFWGVESNQSVNNNRDDGDEQGTSQVETQPDWRRWYILLVYSLVSFTQGGVWNSFSPISETLNVVFGWTDATIATINIIGLLAFMCATPFLTYLMDEKGLRVSVVLASGLVAVGTGVRCISSSVPYVTWIAYVSSLLNGGAGPVGFGGNALVSVVWFPPHQRIIATSLSTALNGLGVAVIFFLAPGLVPVPEYANSTNASWNGNENGNVTNMEEMRQGYMHYMYSVAAWSALLFLVTIAYFPSKPKHAPSVSAAVERHDFWPGVKQLLRMPRFWCFGGTYAVSNGVFQAWTAVMNLNLAPLGVPEKTSGLIGFISQCVGMIASVVIGVFSAFFARRMKMFLIALYVVGTVMFIVFALLCYNIIPFHIEIIFGTVIVGSICLSGAVPLFFELTCEAAYPVAEGVTNGLVTALNNLAALGLMLGLLVPGQDPIWMAWALVGSTAVCLPFFFIIKERYARLDVDEIGG